MRRTVSLLVFLLTAQTALAADALTPASQASGSERRPSKIWHRTGPLGETPKRVSDAFPLSDQQNRGGWVKFEPMSDEFEGTHLDRQKWELGIGGWKGRPPAMFSDKNVTVSEGKLHLTARKEELTPEEEKHGYRDYTSAAVRTKASSCYGYYEVKARPMNSGLSSAFFFIADTPAGLRTEIDVFEIGGNAKGFERKHCMALHASQSSEGKRVWSVSVADHWLAPWRLADDDHVYGLEWDKDEVKYYVDGALVRAVENIHWHHPLPVIFDAEPQIQWMGPLDDKDLPSTFRLEYVRAWKKK